MPSPRGFLNLGLEAPSPESPALQMDSLPTESPGKPIGTYIYMYILKLQDFEIVNFKPFKTSASVTI